MKQPKFYKLRHKPTGLFFKPTGGHIIKVNLSKKGKVYQVTPSLGHLQGSVYLPTEKPCHSKLSKVIPSDWEVVEYELVESSVIPCV